MFLRNLLIANSGLEFHENLVKRIFQAIFPKSKSKESDHQL